MSIFRTSGVWCFGRGNLYNTQSFKFYGKGGDVIKNIANIITLVRIILASTIVFLVPFGPAFWLCYLCGGITDLLDGFIARKLNQQSLIGAKLDSIADMVFAIAIFIIVINNLSLPVWIWFSITLLAILRITSYIIGFYKYRTFSSLHTYANKATGGLIFMFPFLYFIFGINISGIILCFVAFLSSFEELLIILKSKELNRDCKTIFMKSNNL